jgi:hypothetical protein
MKSSTDIAAKPGQPERIAVNCPRCKRIFNAPLEAQAGSVITCPFCAVQMRLRERIVLAAEPIEQA